MLDETGITLPTYVNTALAALEDAGNEAWCVGGCVRDSLLGRPVNDYDIATAAPWTEVERVLSGLGYAVHRTGIEHGTVTAVIDGHALEITTFRTEGGYSDGRHPDSVQFVTSIEEDLARRDFTVNALAFHPERGILDCWGGFDDLSEGVIRAVGDPSQRFKEDGLRILRGCRFASQLGFYIEDETLQAMKSHKTRLLHVSAERITHELDGLLLGEHVHDALMETADVLVAVLPELAACRGFDQHSPYHCYDVWEHVAWVVQNSPATRLNRWAALLHDIGKPAACFFEGERAHFYGHALLSAELAHDILKRLRMSPAFAQDVLTLVRLHDDHRPPTPRNVKRILAQLDGNVELFRALVALKRADALAHSDLGKERVREADELSRVLGDLLAENAAFTIKQLAINGTDVMECGIPAGPGVGEALAAALDAVIEERVPNDREALIAFVRASR